GTLVAALEAGAENAGCRCSRVACEREDRIDLALRDERVRLIQELLRPRRLPRKIDQLPDDDDEADEGAGAERPHHPSAVAPQLGHLFAEREVGRLQTRNLEHE